MNTKNPYITGAPVGNTEIFVGREEVLKDVLEMVRSDNQNAIVLYGQRRIGKTSVLQKLETIILQENENCRVANFDLMSRAKKPFEKVWAELEKRILAQFNQAVLHHGNNSFWDRLSTLLDNDNSLLVLLLDEFDALEEWEQPQKKQAITELFPALLKLLKQHKNFKCVFTIGRDIKHLSSKSFSQLSEIPHRKISLLEETQVDKLINFSEKALDWTLEAIKEVKSLTNGQAYCVQLLCEQIWNHFYSEQQRPKISPQQVKKAASDILSPDIFKEDLWDGLPAAGKVIVSVLSEFEEGATEAQLLEEIRTRGGIANVMQEQLEEVPTSLVTLDFIERVEGEKYKFRVELIRQYVQKFDPFDDVQKELDHFTDRVADEFYATAYKFVHQYQRYDDAIPLLEKTIEQNPRHIKAHQLLARIFLDQRKFEEAEKTLKEFYGYNPRAATPQLRDIYLAWANICERDQDKLKFYDKVLKFDPNHPEAQKQQKEISERLKAKRRRFIEQVKRVIQNYQKRIAQVMAFVVSLYVSYFLPVEFPSFLPVKFPSNLLFEIEKADHNYHLKSVPSSEPHLLASIQTIITNPNIQPREATFKYENYKPVALTPLANTETPTYQIDGEDTLQYPFFEPNQPTPSPFIFTFQFDNNINRNVEFKCKAVDTGKIPVGCEVKQIGYHSILRGIPWWMIGTLFGLLLVIFFEIGYYAWKNRERDDVF